MNHLAVYDEGPEHLPAAVVAHGVGSSARFIRDAFAGPFERIGLRLVTYDLRGHGASRPAGDPADHALDAHVEDLRGVVDACGAKVVGGVSLGAHAAAVLGASTTLGGLIACLPAWTGSMTPDSPHRVVAREIERVGVAGALDRIREDDAMPGWLRRLLVRDWQMHDPDSLAAALVALNGAAAPHGGLLRAIDAPTGLVGWPADPGHPLGVARDWSRYIPNAVLEPVTLEEVGEDASALGAASCRALHAAGWRRSAAPDPSH